MKNYQQLFDQLILTSNHLFQSRVIGRDTLRECDYIELSQVRDLLNCKINETLKKIEANKSDEEIEDSLKDLAESMDRVQGLRLLLLECSDRLMLRLIGIEKECEKVTGRPLINLLFEKRHGRDIKDFECEDDANMFIEKLVLLLKRVQPEKFNRVNIELKQSVNSGFSYTSEQKEQNLFHVNISVDFSGKENLYDFKEDLLKSINYSLLFVKKSKLVEESKPALKKSHCSIS